MSLMSFKRALVLASILVAVFLSLVLAVYVWLACKHPEIIPPSETFGSFWLKNFSILIASAALATTALAAAYNAVEQRTLRYMENYPYLEIFPILTVDPLPLPIPRYDLPPELATFNQDYLHAVAPAHTTLASDTSFRYLAMMLRNAGKGTVTKAFISGKAEVPGVGRPPVKFSIARRLNLAPGGSIPFTVLPIAGLPRYKLSLDEVKYHGHFVELHDFDGPREYSDEFPFEVPQERTVTLFFDHFVDVPAGQGWVLDFWGQWQPTNYCLVPLPTGDRHYLQLSGNSALFAQFPHFNNQMGAYKDLDGALQYGVTVRVSAFVASLPGTTAAIQLWCHDIMPNPKNRYSATITPSESGQIIEMLYTSTQAPTLRIHLLYTPGEGGILVDWARVEGLAT